MSKIFFFFNHLNETFERWGSAFLKTEDEAWEKSKLKMKLFESCWMKLLRAGDLKSEDEMKLLESYCKSKCVAEEAAWLL